MRPIFLNDGVDELLGGGSAAQQAHTALELRHERHGVPDQVPPLDRCVPHLPTCKFPVEDTEAFRTQNQTKHNVFQQQQNDRGTHFPEKGTTSFPSLQGEIVKSTSWEPDSELN